MAASDVATLASLDRIHQRVVIAEDNKLESLLSTLLPGLIALLGQSTAVRAKTFALLQHILKRLKSPDLASIRLPTAALAKLLRTHAGGPKASPFVRNFALIFVGLAAQHTPRSESAALVGTLLTGFATLHESQRHQVFRMVLVALPTVVVPAPTSSSYWAEAAAAAAAAEAAAADDDDDYDDDSGENDAAESDAAHAAAAAPPPPPAGSREAVLSALAGRDRDPRDGDLILAMFLDLLLFSPPAMSGSAPGVAESGGGAALWVPPGLSVAALERLFGPKRSIPTLSELDEWKPAVLAFVASGIFDFGTPGTATAAGGGGVLPHILVAANEARGELRARARSILKALAGGGGNAGNVGSGSGSGASIVSSSGGNGEASATTLSRRAASTPKLMQWLDREGVILAIVTLALGSPGNGAHSARSACSGGVVSEVMKQLCRSRAVATSVRCLKPALALVFGALRADAKTRRLALVLAAHCVNGAAKTLKVWSTLVLKALPPVLEAALRASSGARGGAAAEHCAVAEAALGLLSAVARRAPECVVEHARPNARGGALATLFKIAVRVRTSAEVRALSLVAKEARARSSGGATAPAPAASSGSSGTNTKLVLGATTVFALIRALETVAAAHSAAPVESRAPLRELLFDAASSRSAVARRASIATLSALFSSRDLEVRFLALTLAADREASVRDAAAECVALRGAAKSAAECGSSAIETLREEREHKAAAAELPALPELFAFLWHSESGAGSGSGSGCGAVASSDESPLKRAKVDAAQCGLSEDAAALLESLRTRRRCGERTRLSTLSVPSLKLLLDFIAQCVAAAAAAATRSAAFETTLAATVPTASSSGAMVVEGDSGDAPTAAAGDVDAPSAAVTYLRATHLSEDGEARGALVAYAATLDLVLALTPADAALRRLGLLQAAAASNESAGEAAAKAGALAAAGIAAVETQAMTENLDSLHASAAEMLAQLAEAVPLLALALHPDVAEAPSSAPPAAALTRMALRSRVSAVRASLASVVAPAAAAPAAAARFTVLRAVLCATARAVGADGTGLVDNKVPAHVAHGAAGGTGLEALLSGAHLDGCVRLAALLVATAGAEGAEGAATVAALARFVWSRNSDVRSAATAAVGALAPVGLITRVLQRDVARTAAEGGELSEAKRLQLRKRARGATPASPEVTSRAALIERLLVLARGGGAARESEGAMSCLVALHGAERAVGAVAVEAPVATAAMETDASAAVAAENKFDLARHIEGELLELASEESSELTFLAGTALAKICAAHPRVLARLLPRIIALGGGAKKGGGAEAVASGAAAATKSSEADAAAPDAAKAKAGSSSLRKRRAAAVWILCLAASPTVAAAQLWRASRRSTQQTLIRLLVDETNVAREAAAKALLLLWESVCSEVASTMDAGEGNAAAVDGAASPSSLLLGDLTRALTGGSSQGSAFQATRTTEASAAAATARELCQLVQELGAPALLYDLLARCARSELWSQRIGKSLALAMGSTRTKALFRASLPKLLPRLFWYRHHPTKGVRLAMRELWLRLVGVGDADAITEAEAEGDARDADAAAVEAARAAMEGLGNGNGGAAAVDNLRAAAAAAQAAQRAEAGAEGAPATGRVSAVQSAAAAAVGVRLIATIDAALAALAHQRNWRHCTAGAYAIADLFAAGGAISSAAAAAALGVEARAALERPHAGALLGSDGALLEVLPRVWRATLRSLDAMEPRIQAAGLRAFRELSRFTMRHCNVVGDGANAGTTRASVSAASLGTARALLASTLPWILGEGLDHTSKLARQLAVLTLRDLVRCVGPLVAPHVVELVPALLRAVSSLEPGVLAYLQSHANDEVGNAAEAASANDFGVAMGRGDVERLRSDVARGSPMEEALSLCVRHTDWKEAKLSGFVPALATELAALVRSSVGASFLATRTSTARFIVAFAAAAPKSAVKTAGVTLIRALLDGVKHEKQSALVRRGFVEAAGSLAKHGAKSGSVQKFVNGIIEMHRNALAGTKGNRGGAASNEEAARDAAIAGDALATLTKAAPRPMVRYTATLAPLAWIGKEAAAAVAAKARLDDASAVATRAANEHAEADGWSRLWALLTEGKSSASLLRSVAPTLIDEATTILTSSSWTARAIGTAALTSASSTLFASNGGWAACGLAPAHAMRALDVLKATLSGRAWAGKESAVRAAAQIGADSLAAAMREATGDDVAATAAATSELVRLFLAQSSRGAVSYRRACLVAIATLSSGLRLALSRAATAQSRRDSAAAAVEGAAPADATLGVFVSRCAAARFALWELAAPILAARAVECACDAVVVADVSASDVPEKARDPATARFALEALAALWPGRAIAAAKKAGGATPAPPAGLAFDARAACGLALSCAAQAIGASQQVWAVQCAAIEISSVVVMTAAWPFFVAEEAVDALLTVATKLAGAARDLKHSKLRTAVLALVAAIDAVDVEVPRKAELLQCAVDTVLVLKGDPVSTISDKARIMEARLVAAARKAAQRAAYDAMQTDQAASGNLGGDI